MHAPSNEIFIVWYPRRELPAVAMLYQCIVPCCIWYYALKVFLTDFEIQLTIHSEPNRTIIAFAAGPSKPRISAASSDIALIYSIFGLDM